jgi:hypothetical protein
MVAFSQEEALEAAEDVMNAFVEVQAMLTVPTAEIGSAITFPVPIDSISCSQTSVDAGDLIGRRLQFGGLGDLGLQIDIPCPPRIIFEKVFISMMSSGLGGFPPDKIFIDQIAEPIFCTGTDSDPVRGPCPEGDTDSTEGRLRVTQTSFHVSQAEGLRLHSTSWCLSQLPSWLALSSILLRRLLLRYWRSVPRRQVRCRYRP